MKNMESKGKHLVWIIDEIQMVDKIVDQFTIFSLFKFFIHLTKELHLCHVFILSSDILFIKKIYDIARLQGRADYILIDDFDEDTAGKFLKKYKFTGEEVKYVVDNFGGKPGYLMNRLMQKDLKGN